MNPNVSVIIPTYNRKDLLLETLESVLRQTYRSFEIIVVDDGSTDGTQEMIQSRYGASVRYMTVPHSGLPACPRNAGIQAAHGKWIAFLDSDDLWLSTKLEKQMADAEKNPAAALLYGRAEIFDLMGLHGLTVPAETQRSGMIFNSLLLSNCIPILTVLVRKEILDKVGPFDTRPDFKAVEDYDLWLRIAYRYPVVCRPEILARYRKHLHHTMEDPLPMYQRWEKVLEKTFAENSVPEPVRKRARANLSSLKFRYCTSQTGQEQEAIQHLRKTIQGEPVFWLRLKARGFLLLLHCGGGALLRNIILKRRIHRENNP